MTSQQLKDQINVDITNKTAEASVTAVDVGSNMVDTVTHIDNQITGNVQNNLMPSATKSASVDAVLSGLSSANEYTDDKVAEAITGIFRIAGNYDASAGTFPTTGTGSEGAVRSGDVYIVSVAGTLGGVSYSVNDRFYALVDAPGQTSSNWERFSFNPDEATTDSLGTVERATDAELIAGTPNVIPDAKQVKEYVDNNAGGSPLNYKSYVALISQSGTSAPTVVELDNTLGFTLTWSRSNTGNYLATASGNAFVTNKSGAFYAIKGAFPTAIMKHTFIGQTVMQITTSDAGTATDGALTQTMLEIRVYN